jgi:adenylosuccinate lyase
LIPRYTRPEMGRIWEDENKYRKWLDVELAATGVLEAEGIVPPDAARDIREKADFSVDRILEIEAETRHDVIAFTTAVAEFVGPSSRYFHYGLTSSDVVDTAMALQVADASAILMDDLDRLLEVLKKRAFEFKSTLMVGRTHGIHAEPITFGFKLAIWYDEFQRHRKRMGAVVDDMKVGKLSGAVGTFAHLSPKIEDQVMARLGLRSAPSSSQVVQRDRHASYISTIALIGGSLEKIAVEVRHLQRTEVREAQEYFAKGQKGSSAMPHKRNPVISEQVSGLARILRSNAMAGFENIALWHERDISHSSVERIIFPDSTIVLDYLLDKTTSLLDRLVVYPDRMRENLDMMHGLVFSGQLLLELVERGVTREDAYRWVQRNAMKVWDEGIGFKDGVSADPDITGNMDQASIDSVFESAKLIENVDHIFERVFGSSE